VVLRVDLEAQNCQVLFSGKAQAVQVALRHLRPTSSSPSAKGIRTASRSPSRKAAAVVLDEDVSGALSPEADGTEPSDYIDAGAAAFAAGVAAVSGGGAYVAESADGPAQIPWVTRSEPVAPAQACYQSEACHIPSGAEMAWHSAAPNGERPRSAGAPRSLDVYAGSQPSSISLAPMYGVLSPRGNTHHLVNGSDMTARPAASTVDSEWRAARLEALEARLASVEEEHRAEVAGLRQALEECVRAIGTCAQAIDAMCADSAEALREGHTLSGSAKPMEGAVGEWERAAAALHDAASLGMRALGSTGEVTPHRRSISKGQPLACSSGTATPMTRLPSGTATPVNVEVSSRPAPGQPPQPPTHSLPTRPQSAASLGRAQGTSSASIPQASIRSGSAVPPTSRQSSSPVGSGALGGDMQRRYLVASPTTPPATTSVAAASTQPQHTATITHRLLSRPATHLSGSVSLTGGRPGPGTLVPGSWSSPVGPPGPPPHPLPPMVAGCGACTPPHAPLHGGVPGPAPVPPPQHLAPPGNLLGTFRGLPAAMTGAPPAMGPPMAPPSMGPLAGRGCVVGPGGPFAPLNSAR